MCTYITPAKCRSIASTIFDIIAAHEQHDTTPTAVVAGDLSQFIRENFPDGMHSLAIALHTMQADGFRSETHSTITHPYIFPQWYEMKHSLYKPGTRCNEFATTLENWCVTASSDVYSFPELFGVICEYIKALYDYIHPVCTTMPCMA